MSTPAADRERADEAAREKQGAERDNEAAREKQDAERDEAAREKQDAERGDGAAPLLLRVTRGDPTAAELAALVAVISARGAASAAEGPSDVPASQWAAHSRKLRGPQHQRLGGWRGSALPR